MYSNVPDMLCIQYRSAYSVMFVLFVLKSELCERPYPYTEKKWSLTSKMSRKIQDSETVYTFRLFPIPETTFGFTAKELISSFRLVLNHTMESPYFSMFRNHSKTLCIPGIFFVFSRKIIPPQQASTPCRKETTTCVQPLFSVLQQNVTCCDIILRSCCHVLCRFCWFSWPLWRTALSFANDRSFHRSSELFTATGHKNW